MNKRWLIQRGTIRKSKPENKLGIDALIDWDYMGSAAYEFGALNQSLTRIRDNIGGYSLTSLTLHNKIFTIFAAKNEVLDVESAIKSFSDNPPRLKELAEFDYYCGFIPDCLKKSKLRINFWWDIENDFMWFPENAGFAINLWRAINNKGSN